MVQSPFKNTSTEEGCCSDDTIYPCCINTQCWPWQLASSQSPKPCAKALPHGPWMSGAGMRCWDAMRDAPASLVPCESSVSSTCSSSARWHSRCHWLRRNYSHQTWCQKHSRWRSKAHGAGDFPHAPLCAAAAPCTTAMSSELLCYCEILASIL